MVWAEVHAPKGPRSVHIGAAPEHLGGSIHGVVVGRSGTEVHRNVLSLARRGMYAFGVTRVGGCSDAGPDVCLAEVTLERGIGEIVVGGRVAWSEQPSRPARGERGVGEVAGVITMYC